MKGHWFFISSGPSLALNLLIIHSTYYENIISRNASATTIPRPFLDMALGYGRRFSTAGSDGKVFRRSRLADIHHRCSAVSFKISMFRYSKMSQHRVVALVAFVTFRSSREFFSNALLVFLADTT